MKKSILIAIVLLSQTLVAQKYFTKTGTTKFQASEKSFVPVKAINKKTLAILNNETGEIATQLFITDFQFKVSLMQEHFNENYMDSDEHPKATFVGKLTDFQFDNLSEEKTTFNLKGTLTIKEKQKEINTSAVVNLNGNDLKITSKFTVKPADFNIKIPSIVSKKIAENVQISINYLLSEKK